VRTAARRDRTIAAVRLRPTGLLLLGILILLLPLAGMGVRPGRAAPANHTVDFVVLRPAGPPVFLQFMVAASDPEEAAAAARRAVTTLIPGGHIAAGGVSAQWAPWGWKWSTEEIPVTVAYNPAGAPSSVGPHAVIASLQTWSSVPGSAFAFRYGGITENTASILDAGPDGENVISWAALECSHGCVLGVTSKESTVHEVDMLLNSNPEAATQSGLPADLDWRTVILHELGHVAGLEHSCPVPFGPCTAEELGAVMHYQYRGVQRSLAADDIAGMVALYPAGGPPPPSPGPAEVPVVLDPGWNFLVLPAIETAVIAAELPCLAAMYSHQDGAWKAWIRALPPGLQSLSGPLAGGAYWLYAPVACGALLRPAA